MEAAEAKARRDKGQEKHSKRCDEVRDVVARMTEDRAWDTIQARDLDPRLIDFVAEKLHSGLSPGEVAKALGLTAGRHSKEWKKIQAYFRQGFRADAEIYLLQQTQKFYKVLDQAREVIEEAFEKGTPQLVTFQGNEREPGRTEIVYVKGATKELGSFLKNYSDAISLPVKLWKDFGAIGEKKDGNAAITILVQNQIPMPTPDEIRAHQQGLIDKMKTIEVEARPVKE